MRRRSSVQGGPFMWIAGRQTEVGRDGSGRGSSQRGTAQLGQPDCQLLGDYSKKKPATGGRRMMKFSDECGEMHKLRWIGLPEGLPSAVLARILYGGLEALWAGRVCIVTADRVPAVPFWRI